MAQADYIVSNGTGAAVRSDLNGQLAAIVTNNSGATAPATTYAYQWWADTTTNTLKLRNSANSAWIEIMQLDGTLTMEDGTAALPGLAFRDDLDTGIFRAGTNQLGISSAGVERVEFGSSEVVFNDAGNNYDFRVEGDTNANLLFVDASADAVGIGTGSPDDPLHVVGRISNVVNAAYNVTASYGFAFKNATTPAKRLWGGYDNTADAAFIQSTHDGVAHKSLLINPNGANVGIGTTSPQNNFVVSNGGNDGIEINPTGENSDPAIYSFSRSGDGYRSLTFVGLDYRFNSGSSPSEKARLTSSGQLLVGTSSTSADLMAIVQGTSGGAKEGGPLMLARANAPAADGYEVGILEFAANNHVAAAKIFAARDGGTWTAGSSQPTRLVFSTTADGASSPTERMRIANDGTTFIGTSLPWFSRQLVVEQSSQTAAFINSNSAAFPVSVVNASTSGDSIFVGFYTETRSSPTQRATIDFNRAAGQVRYNVSSDRRLKLDIKPAGTALDALSAIQVRSYKWAETGYRVDYGFIAQELNEVAPDAVKVGDDGEEVTDTWAVDTSKLVPLLTKALQEAIAKIETLEARLTALESA